MPLKKQQRLALAYLTLRHRGKVPDIEGDPALARIWNQDKRKVRNACRIYVVEFGYPFLAHSCAFNVQGLVENACPGQRIFYLREVATKFHDREGVI